MFDYNPRIKSIVWENRVKRTGFLQSKDICNEAETTPIRLIGKIYVSYDNIFWVSDYNLYDDNRTKSFIKYFDAAFAEDRAWPKRIIKSFDSSAKKILVLTQKLKRTDWRNSSKNNKIISFQEYVKLLKDVQKYYVLAVPLTNYCESKLKKHKDILESYANPYKQLEIEMIWKSKDVKKEFPWIKTAYNIIDEMAEDDIKKIAEKSNISRKIKVPGNIKYLVDALQIGIYIRNRVKELSQRLGYFIEPLAVAMAKDIDVTRDEFFLLTYDEAISSAMRKKIAITAKELRNRKKSFAVGFLDRKRVVISGKKAEELVKYYSNANDFAGTLKGNIGFKGKVSGKVKLVLDKKAFNDFKAGEILVTSMTTPDFVVLMQKAKAIVTDEGGLSCHAAIVSREMKKPCIIGTKNATNVLKDGDLIEVDADKGIINKLK